MKISLNQQIDAVNLELKDLIRERPDHERKRGYRKAEYDFQIERLEAVVVTLNWFQRHEITIRNAVEGKS